MLQLRPNVAPGPRSIPRRLIRTSWQKTIGSPVGLYIHRERNPECGGKSHPPSDCGCVALYSFDCKHPTGQNLYYSKVREFTYESFPVEEWIVRDSRDESICFHALTCGCTDVDWWKHLLASSAHPFRMARKHDFFSRARQAFSFICRFMSFL